MSEPTWKISIDWNRDGDFSDAGEDITAYVMRASWNNGARQPYQRTADEPRCTITVYNNDMRFSPEYSSGPLYGSLVPLRPVKVEAVYNGTAVPMWRGWLRSVQPTPFTHGDKTAVLKCQGMRYMLSDAAVNVPLMENVTADEALEVVLGQVATPPSLTHAWLAGVAGYSEAGVTTYATDTSTAYSMDTGITTFPYVGDTWGENTSAWNAVQSLVQSECGRFFWDREGRAVFFNRHRFLVDYTNDGTVTNTMQGVQYGYGTWMVNDVTATAEPRNISAGTVVLWESDNEITVKAGATRSIRARYTDQDGNADIAGRNVEQPASGNSTFVQTGNASITEWEADARSASFTIDNTGASSDTTVTTAIVKGRKLTSWNKQEARVVDETNVSLYGRASEKLNTDLINNIEEAQSIAEYEISQRSDPSGFVDTITLMNRDAATQALMFDMEIGSRVHVEETRTAHSADYHIVGESHELSDGLRLHTVTWTTERADAAQYWLAGVAGYSEAGETTRAGY